MIYPVILSGGAGTRLWPLSRAQYPKQFLTLIDDHSMLQTTALRVRDPSIFAPPTIIANAEHRFLVAEQLRAVGVEAATIVLEPVGRNSAPAAAVAAALVHATDSDGLVLLLAADHAMSDPAAFTQAVERAAPAAEAGALIVFGIRPDRPETGYGYVQVAAERTDAPGVYTVARFVEKPDSATATTYLTEGGYVWNSGNFLARAAVLEAEITRHAPEITKAANAAIAKARMDLDFLRLDADTFARAPSISLDYAVMERTNRAAVVLCDPGWSDVGSFTALRDVTPRDDAGNALIGDVLAFDARDSLISSSGPLVAALGVERLVVVATDDAVLVADADRAQDVKVVVDRLKQLGRGEATNHPEVHRPWGSYRTLDLGPGFQVKQIKVKPGGRLSLQSHAHRAEHWVVIEGVARVTRGPSLTQLETVDLEKNQSIDIPLGWIHRLENPTDTPTAIVEVQSGSYLEEDDITRYDDVYGRN